MRLNRRTTVAWILASGLGLGASGCQGTISPDMTLAEALGQIDVLNQITVGDLIEGFQNFLTNAGDGHGFSVRVVTLSPDQAAEIEELQGRLDRGEITRDEFAQQVQGLVGDAAPDMAFGGFGFFGAPVGQRFGGRRAELLELTDEQQAQAREIFRSLHEDIDALRRDAHERIGDVLTDEQRARLDEMRSPRFGVPFGPPRHGFHPRGHDRSGRRFFERLSDELGLTDDQREEIRTIREELRNAIRDRHELAREEFRSILTDEQLVLLDTVEHQPRPADEVPTNDAPRDDAPRDDAPRDDAPRDDAPRDDAPRG